MGAWGEGMQANDTALDYIGKFQDFDKKSPGLPLNKAGRAVVNGLASLYQTLRRIGGTGSLTDSKGMAVLGIAEFFLDNGAKLDDETKLYVQKAITDQLLPGELKTWGGYPGDCYPRERALLLFRDRVNGKVVDAKEVAKGNEGLLSKISPMLQKEKSAGTLKIKGGHRIDFDKSGEVFVTDDSGERGEVDRDMEITFDGGSFSIPIKGGGYTAASPEEAFVVSQMAHMVIVAGARRWRVEQVGEVR